MLQDIKLTHSICKADCTESQLSLQAGFHGGNILRWVTWKHSPFPSSVKLSHSCHCIFGKRRCERGRSKALMYHYINCLRDLTDLKMPQCEQKHNGTCRRRGKDIAVKKWELCPGEQWFLKGLQKTCSWK